MPSGVTDDSDDFETSLREGVLGLTTDQERQIKGSHRRLRYLKQECFLARLVDVDDDYGCAKAGPLR